MSWALGLMLLVSAGDVTKGALSVEVPTKFSSESICERQAHFFYEPYEHKGNTFQAFFHVCRDLDAVKGERVHRQGRRSVSVRLQKAGYDQ